MRERVSGLLKGCKCNTGCRNRICGRVKKGNSCSEGCECVNCENTSPSHSPARPSLRSYDLREDLADIVLEEEVQNNTTVDKEDEKFAQFVFVSATDDGTVELNMSILSKCFTGQGYRTSKQIHTQVVGKHTNLASLI